MKRYVTLALLFISILYSKTQAQQTLASQMKFEDTTGAILTITDSQIDDSGNVISIGPVTNQYNSFIIKTDKRGNLLWKRKISWPDLQKIKIARNGDYLFCGGIGSLYIGRISTTGNLLWHRRAGFQLFRHFPQPDITELDNGNIAMCGSNTFEKPNTQGQLYHGFIQMYKGSDGNLLWCKSYFVEGYMGWAGNTHFYNITCLADTMYITGEVTAGYYYAGYVLAIDTMGNITSVHGYDTVSTSNGEVLSHNSFINIAARNGKIFVSGTLKDNSNKEALHISSYDPSNGEMKGTIYRMHNRDTLNPHVYIKNSNEYHLALDIDPLWTVAGSVRNNQVRLMKKFQTDHPKEINCVAGSNDTVIAMGSFRKKYGYFAYLTEGTGTYNTCTVMDTILSTTYHQTFSTNILLPEIYNQVTYFDYFFLPVSTNYDLLQRQYLCPSSQSIPFLSFQKNADVYPNPTDGIIHIKNKISIVNYTLHNAIGVLVKQGAMHQGENVIDISQSPSGIYILEMIDAQGNRQKEKILKQ